MTTYARRGYGRPSYAPQVGRVQKPNRRPGACRDCSEQIPAGGGQLYRESSGAWSVVHWPAEQGGWLMSPQPVTGGCPADTDKRNAEFHASGFFGRTAELPASEREHVAAMARAFARESAQDTSRGKYAYTSSGARMTSRRGRCEDAPCCGCCD